MKVVYLGSFPASKMIASSNGRIDSLYRDDHALIKGLRSVKGIDLMVFTIPIINSYPSNPIYMKGFYDISDDVYSLPVLNLPVIRLLWTIFILFYKTSSFIKKTHEQVVVITPYIIFHHIIPAYFIKCLYRNHVKLVLVAPDIFFPKGWLKKRLNKISEKMAKKHDAFIFYTAAMANYLDVSKKPFVVIEGFNEIIPHNLVYNSGTFKILYSGSLNIEYGLGRLVDAMSFIPSQDVELHLLGDGNAVEFIKMRSLNDARIIYKGKVSKSDAMDALYTASVLVNPRNSSDGEYVEYSFPSKDIDYLGSGIPSVLCKLPGMPKEYYGYFVDAGNGSPKELAEAIISVYNMSIKDRKQMGEQARRFISKRMDLHEQGLKIMSMIEKII